MASEFSLRRFRSITDFRLQDGVSHKLSKDMQLEVYWVLLRNYSLTHLDTREATRLTAFQASKNTLGRYLAGRIHDRLEFLFLKAQNG